MRILHVKAQTCCCEMGTFMFCPKLGFLDCTRVSSESINTWRLWQKVGIIHPPVPLNSSTFLHFECTLRAIVYVSFAAVPRTGPSTY